MRSFDPTSERIINDALAEHPAVVVAFSGGLDSLTLVDFVCRFTSYRPGLLWVHPGVMEFDETEPYIRSIAAEYGLALHIVRVDSDPVSQWERHGWPILGKSSGAVWNKTHRGYGFKAGCSDCCRRRKIAPGRKWMKANGITCQLVGTRRADSASRDLRSQKDGTAYETDGITVAAPLSHWTDLRSRVYRRRYNLRVHPTRDRLTTTGCQCCLGGCQFETSTLRELRLSCPQMWRRAVEDFGLGPIILAIKHNCSLTSVRAAVEVLGGLERLMLERPHIFDFTRRVPLESYSR